MLTLTIVIPVYNEERHIKATLQAISRQSIMPDEVIVVDNNCTDNTVKIAKKFPFVRIVKESKQGLIHARNTGFNTVKSDIIGRIDADSIVDIDWVQTVVEEFTKQKDISGLTGPARGLVLPLLNAKTTVGSKMYFWFVNAGFNIRVLWGANMAIRRSSWKKVASKVCLDDSSVHEDLDVSILLAATGKPNAISSKMLITTNGHEFRKFRKIIYYVLLYFKTRKHHINLRSLKRAKNVKLGYVRTFPQRVISNLLLILLIIVGIIFTPYDYIKKKLN